MMPRETKIAAAVVALAAIVVGFIGLLTAHAPLAIAGYGVAVVLWLALKIAARQDPNKARPPRSGKDQGL